jgi:hypothetical protein
MVRLAKPHPCATAHQPQLTNLAKRPGQRKEKFFSTDHRDLKKRLAVLQGGSDLFGGDVSFGQGVFVPGVEVGVNKNLPDDLHIGIFLFTFTLFINYLSLDRQGDRSKQIKHEMF